MTDLKKDNLTVQDGSGIPLNQLINLIIFIFLAAFPLLGFSQFRSEFMAEAMAMMIFGISIDLIWGYAGLLSLGHAVMFGLGAYIVGIHSNVMAGLPGFMKENGLKSLPFLFKLLKSPSMTIILALLIPLVLGVIISWFLFRGKVGPVFFTIVTMIMAAMFTDIILDQIKYTNGYNGLQNIDFLIPNVSFTAEYYIVLVTLAIVFLIAWKITNSKFGIMLKAIKSNESRVLFLGYDTVDYKIAVYGMSSCLAGFAGFMFAQIHGAIAVDNVGVAQSVFAVICVAFGGRGYLTGALLGTLILQWFNNLTSEYFGGIWQAILGVILLIVVFFMPEGIIGKLQDITDQKKP